MLNFIACLLLALAPTTHTIDSGWKMSNVGDASNISHSLAVPLPPPGLTEVKSEIYYQYRHIGTVTNHTDATLFLNIGGTMVYTLSHNANQQNWFDNVQGGGNGPLVVVPPGETREFITQPMSYPMMTDTYPIAPWYTPMGVRRLHRFYLTPHYFSTYQVEWIGTPHYSGHYPYSLDYVTQARMYGTITYQ